MFDIGFWELTVIAVMGLVILGPERLPTALRSIVKTVRSVRNMANNVKQDISQELHLHELHENLKKAESQGLDNLNPELQESLDKLRDAAASVQRPYESKPDKSKSEQSKLSETDTPVNSEERKDD